ncbi:uncharacterized protein F5147DRAFT_563542 [Suillus discolor]|uniref:Uncharacterized protein n=1 Tax=Suillus discolor TaxID=1912936 RepID=A0A9P7FKF4_9AGAM|nr:uncharacterized protein F5147DRAFT_563542 [Suillus discolor]KAG2120445.1 hypothetical protein F5147DRAFT_563542 [Suillus discolor]
MAADALSRRMSGQPWKDGDGSTWSVSEDWESAHGLVNDLLHLDDTDTTITELKSHFVNEPLFMEVIEAIHNLDSAKSEQDRRRARHRALGYSIEEGRLWRIVDGKSIRARPRLECMSQAEATEMARQEHTNNRHWGRDLTKLKLMDHIYHTRGQTISTTRLGTLMNASSPCSNIHLRSCYWG